jgi:hypothetical protein
MELSISDPELCKKIVNKLNELRASPKDGDVFIDYPNNKKTDQTNFEYRYMDNISILYIDEQIKIEFYENKPPHSRYIFSDQINIILSRLKTLAEVIIHNIDRTSWFCILWTPVKSTKAQFMNTSFLVYYQFEMNNTYFEETFSNHAEIPLIGILPIKFEDSMWLSKISKGKIE